MRTKLRGKFWLLFMILGLLLAVPAIALADIIVADGDIITTGNQAGTAANPIDIGKVKAGGSVSRQVSIQLVCNGNKHVDQGQTITLDATPGTTGVPAGGSLTATAATIGPVPASWPDDSGTNTDCATTPQTLEDNGNTTVTFNAPSNAANGTVYDFTVTWSNSDVSLTPGGTQDSSAITGNTQVFFRVTIDSQAPTVTSVAPTDGASGVAIGTNVDATFSEDMDATTTDGDPSTIDGSTFTLTKPDGPDADTNPDPVTGVVTYDSATKKATLNPDNDLDYSTTYTATVTTGAQDVVGNALDQDSGAAGNQPKTWTFTTAAPPCTPVSVTTQPEDKTITCGENATFTAAANGSPAMDLWNTVKGGSTVPLKFNVYAGSVEKTSLSDIKGLTAQQLKTRSTDQTAVNDPVDFTTTETTSLRYDTTAKQWIQNWKTPKVGSETCYRATVTFADGSSISAFFKLLK